MDFARHDCERDVVESNKAAEAPCHPLDFQERVHGYDPALRQRAARDETRPATPCGIKSIDSISSRPKPISWKNCEKRSHSLPKVRRKAPNRPPQMLPIPPTTIMASALMVSKSVKPSGVM